MRFHYLNRFFALLAIIPLVLTTFSVNSPTAPGNYVAITGDQFTYNGQPVKLKGMNYYPQLTPWAVMFDHWQGDAVNSDMARLQNLGANVVRVLIPYGNYDWTDKSGAIDPKHLANLEQLVQAAGNHNLKVELTLFDFYSGAPAAGSAEEGQNLTYITQMVKAFGDDDRIFAWDIHNEPDNYGVWTDRRHPDLVIDWLRRMAAALHTLDHNHPVTVGYGNYQNYWLKGPNGVYTTDFVDFISLHSYDAGNIVAQIQNIKLQSSKPILLEETGWPTGPSCNTLDYNEATQQRVYSIMVAAAQAQNIGGLFAWTLWDYRLGQSHGGGVESRDDHFGLLRLDGSEKPAMADFRAYSAPPLPSVTSTSLQYTTAPYDPTRVLGNREYGTPLYFAPTNVYVWDAFKQYWLRFGGLPIFGYPLTMARKETLSDGQTYVVQYFERARFELHNEALTSPDYNALSHDDQLRRLVELTPLGDLATSTRNFAPVPAPTTDQLAADGSLTYFPQTGHTLGGLFHQFWLDNNGLANFGYPISQLIQEVNPSDGHTYYVQYFERQRFEWHQDMAGTPYEVQLGQLGREWLVSHVCLN